MITNQDDSPCLSVNVVDERVEHGPFTDDELKVQLLSVLLSIEQRRNRSGFSFLPLVTGWPIDNWYRIDAIRADIISTAAGQKRSDYRVDQLAIEWAARGNVIPYVPAVTGGGLGEFEDWDVPGVMQRRAALRASPLVQDILRSTLQ
jgi:hypothetical protein